MRGRSASAPSASRWVVSGSAPEKHRLDRCALALGRIGAGVHHRPGLALGFFVLASAVAVAFAVVGEGRTSPPATPDVGVPTRVAQRAPASIRSRRCGCGFSSNLQHQSSNLRSPAALVLLAHKLHDTLDRFDCSAHR